MFHGIIFSLGVLQGSYLQGVWVGSPSGTSWVTWRPNSLECLIFPFVSNFFSPLLICAFSPYMLSLSLCSLCAHIFALWDAHRSFLSILSFHKKKASLIVLKLELHFPTLARIELETWHCHLIFLFQRVLMSILSLILTWYSYLRSLGLHRGRSLNLCSLFGIVSEMSSCCTS